MTAEHVAALNQPIGGYNNNIIAQQQGVGQVSNPNFLQVPVDKQLQDILNRNWTVWAEDENICIYVCRRNKRDQMLRVDVRLERRVPPNQRIVSGVKLVSSVSPAPKSLKRAFFVDKKTVFRRVSGRVFLNFFLLDSSPFSAF